MTDPPSPDYASIDTPRMRSTALTIVISTVIFIMGLSFVIGRCSAPDDAGDGDSDAQHEATTEPPTTWAPETAPDLVLERPDAFIDALYDRFEGVPLNAQSVTIYPQYAYADVQDPDEPRHLDEYDFRSGVLQPGSEPVAAGRFEDWESTLFTLESVQPDVIRRTAAEALDEFDELENAQISYVDIERTYGESGAYDGPVHLTFYVSDPIRGGGGRMETTTQGDVIGIDRY